MLVTARIQRMREGTVFTGVCLSMGAGVLHCDQAKMNFSYSKLDRLTPSCQFMGQNSKYPVL